MRIKIIKNLNIVLAILLIISILIIINLIHFYGVEKLPFTKEKIKEILEIKEVEDPLSLEGFSEVNVTIIQPNNIVLTNKECISISMATTDQQIYSIGNGLEDKTKMRPTAHDLIKNTLENFDIKVLMVKISSIKEGTYYANLFLKQENKILNLDARPSDSIAIAIRTNAKIYVKKDLLTQYGQKSC